MKTSPDFNEGDRLLSQMTLEKMMETIFEETALSIADGTQPMFSLTLGKSKGWFSRNLIQCFLLDLHLELKKRNDTIDSYGSKHVRKGKLVLPIRAAGVGTGAAGVNGHALPAAAAGTHECDGVGVSESDAVDGKGGAA